MTKMDKDQPEEEEEFSDSDSLNAAEFKIEQTSSLQKSPTLKKQLIRQDQDEEQKGDQYPPGMNQSNSSAKKEASSIARYIDVSPCTYEFPWQSTFMSYI